MKKIIIVSTANLIAFICILTTIYSEAGVDVFYKILLPALVMYAANTGTNVAVISILHDRKTKETTESSVKKDGKDA